jgi:hypothetical protein
VKPSAKDRIVGLGFFFIEDGRWVIPNPIGLQDFHEALCPPNYADMHAVVEAFVERKFGTGGGGHWCVRKEFRCAVHASEAGGARRVLRYGSRDASLQPQLVWASHARRDCFAKRLLRDTNGEELAVLLRRYG